RRCQCPKMQPSFMRCANRSSVHCRCPNFRKGPSWCLRGRLPHMKLADWSA
ncbi:unnamed protein product, partial [Cladocopium goreaui]